MWVSILLPGVQAPLQYLSTYVLVCLISAFLIAGAISSMVKKEGVKNGFWEKSTGEKA